MKKLTFADMQVGDVFTIKHTKTSYGYANVEGSPDPNWFVSPSLAIHEVLESSPRIGDKYQYAPHGVTNIKTPTVEFRGKFDDIAVLKNGVGENFFSTFFPKDYIKVES